VNRDTDRATQNGLKLFWLRLLSIGSPIVAGMITLSIALAFESWAVPFNRWPEIVLLVNMALGAGASAAAGFYSHRNTAVRVTRAFGNLVVGLVAYVLTIVIVGSVFFG